MSESSPIRIVDAHVHQWDPRTTPRAVSPLVKLLGWNPKLLTAVGKRVFPRALLDFVGNPEHALAAYLPANLRADWGSYADRVDGVVHVQAMWEGRKHIDKVGETRWLAAIDPEGTIIKAMVGEAQLDAPDLDAVLDAHAQASDRFVGIRDSLSHSPARGVFDFARSGELMRDDRWRRGFAELGARDLTFDAWCYHHQLRDLASLVRDIPQTRVVVCHLGSPVGVAGPYAGVGTTPAEREAIESEWRASIAELAAVDHVQFKISGMLMPIIGFGYERWEVPMSQQEYVDRVGPFIQYMLDTVGIERCLFGSNFPMDKVSIRYETVIAGLDELLGNFELEPREGFWAGNARRFYGLTTRSD